MRNVLLSLVISLSACEVVDSTSVNTDGIYAAIEVSAHGNGMSFVRASLLVGGSASNTSLELVDGDVLYAYLGAEPLEMQRDEGLFGDIDYTAAFDGDGENTPFRVEFTRVGHDAAETECRGGDAPNSFATLPAPFELSSPAANGSLSRANDDLIVNWTEFDRVDPLRITVSGPCIDTVSMAVDDSGAVIIPADTILLLNQDSEQQCAAQVSLTRSRSGFVDTNYGEGGHFNAQQVRSFSFTTIP